LLTIPAQNHTPQQMTTTHYRWTPADKLRYALSLIPFLALIAGTAYILKEYPLFIIAGWFSIYLVVNIFQAGCCVGCPYRGKYCPAFVGVFIGNFLSTLLYRNREHDPAFFKRNAAGGEITLIIFLLFPLYWIFKTEWWYTLIYLGLLALHIFLFMPTQCSKCSYSETCPGGKAYQSYCKIISRKTNS